MKKASRFIGQTEVFIIRGKLSMEREQTTIRLPAELKEQIQQQADKLGISFNEFVMMAINNYLNRHEVE